MVNFFDRRYLDMYWIYAYRQKKFQDMITEIEAIQRAPPKVVGVFNFGPE